MATTIITRSTVVEKLSAIKNVARREIERRSVNRRGAFEKKILPNEVGIPTDTWSSNGADLTERAGKSRGLPKSVTDKLPEAPAKATTTTTKKSSTKGNKRQAPRVRSSSSTASEAFRRAFEHFPEGSKLQRATAVTASGLVNHHGVEDINEAVAQAIAKTEQRVREGKLADPLGCVTG